MLLARCGSHHKYNSKPAMRHRHGPAARRVTVVALVVASASAQSYDDSYGKTINEQLGEFMARPYLMIDSMAAAIDSGELLSSDGAAPLGIDRERARHGRPTPRPR